MAFKTRSQKMAEAVYPKVNEIAKRNDKKLEGKYATLCRKFGTMVLTNGLIQTVAFFESKKDKEEHIEFLKHLRVAVPSATMSLLRECTLSEYMDATRKCLLAGHWFKRFAEAHLEGGEEE